MRIKCSFVQGLTVNDSDCPSRRREIAVLTSAMDASTGTSDVMNDIKNVLAEGKASPRAKKEKI